MTNTKQTLSQKDRKDQSPECQQQHKPVMQSLARIKGCLSCRQTPWLRVTSKSTDVWYALSFTAASATISIFLRVLE